MRLRHLSALAATAVAGLTLTTLAPGSATADTSGDISYIVNPITVPGTVSATTPAALPSPTQCLAAYGLSCNTADSERAAYNIPKTVNGELAGTGETIAIVDVWGSPTAQADLDTFSAAMGIPSTHLNISYPTGKIAWNKHEPQTGWALETSLDIQWAHAIAPGATIDLVLASNARGDTINEAVKYAVGLHPDTLSMSFGNYEGSQETPEADNIQYTQLHKILADAAAQGTTSFASSGDWGSDNGFGSEEFLYPASDDNVVAVGGTTLYKNVDPSQPAEVTWGDYSACPFTCHYGVMGETGGAPSLIYGKQGSDISLNASIYTSVLVYGSWPGVAPGFHFVGGTSSSSPQWAGIGAILDQQVGHDLGNIRPLLADWASAGALNDVTVGDNTSPTFQGGYSAGPGWDIPTGYGTPDVGKLMSLVS